MSSLQEALTEEVELDVNWDAVFQGAFVPNSNTVVIVTGRTIDNSVKESRARVFDGNTTEKQFELNMYFAKMPTGNPSNQ